MKEENKMRLKERFGKTYLEVVEADNTGDAKNE